MIYEYALEPALVATWHDRATYSFFEERFGLNTRRIVSQFPKKWKKSIWEIFNNGTDAENQNSKMRMGALLDELCQNSIRRNTAYGNLPTWLEQAENENNSRPFRAILSDSNPRNNSNVIDSAILVSNGHSLWLVPDNPPVPRTAQDLSDAIAPILRVSNRIYFLDPHFNLDDDRFREPMERYLTEIWQNHHISNNPFIELQIGIDQFFQPYERYQNRNPQQETRVCNNFNRNLENWLRRLMPANRSVHVKLVKQREFGELLHNRYLLTEICGVMFGTGTDRTRDLRNQETDILSLLNHPQYLSRWNQIVGNPPAYDLVHSFNVIGVR